MKESHYMAVRYHVGTKIGKNSGAGISFGNKEISDGYLIFLIIPIMIILALVQWFFQNILITGPILGIIVALIAIWIKTAPIRAERRRIENLVDNIKTDYDFIIEHDNRPSNFEQLIDSLSEDLAKLNKEIIESDPNLMAINKFTEAEKIIIANDNKLKIDDLANKIKSHYDLIKENKSGTPGELIDEITQAFTELGELNNALLNIYPFLKEIKSDLTYWENFYKYSNLIDKTNGKFAADTKQYLNYLATKSTNTEPSRRRSIDKDDGHGSINSIRADLDVCIDTLIKQKEDLTLFDEALKFAKSHNITDDYLNKVAEATNYASFPWFLEDVKKRRKILRESIPEMELNVKTIAHVFAIILYVKLSD
jgi:hypothetical protein